MPKSNVPASAIVLPAYRVTNLHRRAIMNAAHRMRRAFGVTIADALKAAWSAFRRAQRNRWPTDHITMPFERIQLPELYRSHKPLMTRQSGRLAWSFSA